MALQASCAMKILCAKGHNWLTTQSNRFRHKDKCGYNQIQPKLLPKGLSTFKVEHCNISDEEDDRNNFLIRRGRAHSIDVIDSRARINIMQLNEGAQNISQIQIDGNGIFPIYYFFELYG